MQRQLDNAGFSVEQGRQIIANLVDQEAIMLAVNHTFLVSAGVLFLAAALVWLSPRPKRVVDTSAAH